MNSADFLSLKMAEFLTQMNGFLKTDMAGGISHYCQCDIHFYHVLHAYFSSFICFGYFKIEV